MSYFTTTSDENQSRVTAIIAVNNYCKSDVKLTNKSGCSVRAKINIATFYDIFTKLYLVKVTDFL